MGAAAGIHSLMRLWVQKILLAVVVNFNRLRWWLRVDAYLAATSVWYSAWFRTLKFANETILLAGMAAGLVVGLPGFVLPLAGSIVMQCARAALWGTVAAVSIVVAVVMLPVQKIRTLL